MSSTTAPRRSTLRTSSSPSKPKKVVCTPDSDMTTFESESHEGTPSIIIEEDATSENMDVGSNLSFSQSEPLGASAEGLSSCPITGATGKNPHGTSKESIFSATNGPRSSTSQQSEDVGQVQKVITEEIKTIYDRLLADCERIEQAVAESEQNVIRKEEMAFLMNRHQIELSILLAHQEEERKEKELSFRKLMDARSERKKAKALHRKAIRDTKRRDLIISRQEDAAHSSRRARESLVEKRKGFEALLEHIEQVHDRKRKQLLAAQERRMSHEKMLYESQTRHLTEEVRSAMLKKFQVRQNHQGVLNKRLYEHMVELQQLEVRHAKEKFDLQSRTIDEISNLRLQHSNKLAEMSEAHLLELNSEKEKILTKKEARKLRILEAQHAGQMKQMLREHRIAVRQLKIGYEQKIGAKSRSGASTPGSARNGPGSKLASRSGSSESLHSYMSANANDRQSLTSPLNGGAGGTLTASFGFKAAAAARDRDDLDLFDGTESINEEGNKIESTLEVMRRRQQNEKEELETLIKKEMNELTLSIEAKMTELEEAHEQAISEMVSMHEAEIKQLTSTQEKEIQMEQNVHDAEMKMLVERRILNSVLETVVDAIVNITPKGIVVRFNAAAAKMFGYEVHEVVGQNIKMLMPEDHAVKHDGYLKNYLTTGVKKVIGSGRRAYGKKKDGSLFPIHLSVSEVKEHDEHLFTGIVRDLTEEVRIEEETKRNEEEKQKELQGLISQLDVSRQKADDLLSQMLPPSVSSQLLEGKTVAPQSYDSATIFFLDVVGFTTICSGISPMDTVSMLNGIYTVFDNIIQQYDAYKVETIGDSYMVVSGLPARNGMRHASEIATMALHILSAVYTYVIPQQPDRKLKVRIGINTGPVVAGVVGSKMPRYCLFGDTVNTASRMESSGEPMKIQISESTYEILTQAGDFRCSMRGETQIKGKGKMTTYWLTGKQGFPYELPPQ